MAEDIIEEVWGSGDKTAVGKPTPEDEEKVRSKYSFLIGQTIEEEYLYGFTIREAKEIKKLIEDNLETLKNAWNEYFGQ